MRKKSKPFILIGSWQMKECLVRRLIYWDPDSYQYSTQYTDISTVWHVILGQWWSHAMSGWYESWSSICRAIRQCRRDGKRIYRERSVLDLNSLQYEYYCVFILTVELPYLKLEHLMCFQKVYEWSFCIFSYMYSHLILLEHIIICLLRTGQVR